MHRGGNSQIPVTEFFIIVNQPVLAGKNQSFSAPLSGILNHMFHQIRCHPVTPVFRHNVKAKNALINSIRLMKAAVHLVPDRPLISGTSVDKSNDFPILLRNEKAVRKSFDSGAEGFFPRRLRSRKALCFHGGNRSQIRCLHRPDFVCLFHFLLSPLCRSPVRFSQSSVPCTVRSRAKPVSTAIATFRLTAAAAPEFLIHTKHGNNIPHPIWYAHTWARWDWVRFFLSDGAHEHPRSAHLPNPWLYCPRRIPTALLCCKLYWGE